MISSVLVLLHFVFSLKKDNALFKILNPVADVAKSQMLYYTQEVSPSFAKPPLDFNSGIAKLWLSSSIK